MLNYSKRKGGRRAEGGRWREGEEEGERARETSGHRQPTYFCLSISRDYKTDYESLVCFTVKHGLGFSCYTHIGSILYSNCHRVGVPIVLLHNLL